MKRIACLVPRLALIPGLALALGLAVTPAAADPANFSNGPVLNRGGGVAAVAADMPLPPGKEWKMAFDVPAATAGKLNPHIDAAARYINMLVAAGVSPGKVKTAIVVHGGGLMDLLDAPNYARETDGKANPNAALLAELMAKGVPVYVCGQSAELLGIAKSDMIPGVSIALSAMTAHEMLQNQGYAVKPF